MVEFSDEYVQQLSVGAFAGRLDPWAEAGRYFKQIHAGFISDLLEQLRHPLLRMGYVAGRETSLQIVEQRQPDVFITHPEVTRQIDTWSYAAAAEAIHAEPGISIEWEIPELQAITVSTLSDGELVTIIEVISPRNKLESTVIEDYSERRERYVQAKGVNVVEIDLTRSVKRLLRSPLVATYPYHAAVYLPHEVPRVIGIEFDTPLKRLAIPLRNAVVGVDLQAAYDHAYQQASIAAQILTETGYDDTALPFPSLFTQVQREQLRTQVQQWQATLTQLRDSSA